MPFRHALAAAALYRASGSCATARTASALQSCFAGPICPLDALGVGDRDARLLVTARTLDSTLIENPHPIAIYFSTPLQKWPVFDQGSAEIPNGAQFNVTEILVLLEDDFESGDLVAWSANAP
jgi:hypothetical protein